MLSGYLGDNSSSVFKLEIDGDKLSSRYRIKPYRCKTMNAGYLDEYEEQVQTNNWFTSEGTRHGNFPNILKIIKEKYNQVGLDSRWLNYQKG